MRRAGRSWFLLLSFLLLLYARRLPFPPEPQPLVIAPPTLLFTGDLVLAGRVGRLVEAEGPSPLLAEVREVLERADLAVGNLECALATTGRPASKRYTFRGRPEAAQALAEAGYDVLTLANNHSVDYGPAALLETLAAVRKHGMLAVGAGRDRAEAGRFPVIARGSPPVRIAVLAFSHMLPTSFYASPTRPGTNPAGIAEVRADVAAAPSPSQRYLAEAAVEAGADLVVGHHPHVLQGLERRGHALVAYSLGNFLFPSRGQAQRTVILHYTATSEGAARAQLVPCVVDDFRPRLATGSEREQILEHVAALSHPLGLTLGPDGTIALPPRRASVDKASRRP